MTKLRAPGTSRRIGHGRTADSSVETEAGPLLEAVRGLFRSEGHARAFSRVRSGSVVGPAPQERGADRQGGGRAGADAAGVFEPVEVGRGPDAGSPAGDRDRGARQPASGGRDRRDQLRQAGGQDAGREAAVLRQHRQDGELRGHGPLGLRSRRFPLPAGRRVVPAAGLARGPRALSPCGHPRGNGLPFQMEDRLGVAGPRAAERRETPLVDVRRGIRGKTWIYRHFSIVIG